MMQLSLDEMALIIASRAHSGQFRKYTDHPYIVHPVRVCDLVRKYYPEYYKDVNVRAAALLHDVIEDTDTSYTDLEKTFGSIVTDLVEQLTTNDEECDALGKGVYLKLKLIKMSPEARAIKLCDRLDNLTDSGLCSKMLTQMKIDETCVMLYAFDRIKPSEQDKIVIDKIVSVINQKQKEQ